MSTESKASDKESESKARAKIDKYLELLKKLEEFKILKAIKPTEKACQQSTKSLETYPIDGNHS